IQAALHADADLRFAIADLQFEFQIANRKLQIENVRRSRRESNPRSPAENRASWPARRRELLRRTSALGGDRTLIFLTENQSAESVLADESGGILDFGLRISD